MQHRGPTGLALCRRRALARLLASPQDVEVAGDVEVQERPADADAVGRRHGQLEDLANEPIVRNILQKPLTEPRLKSGNQKPLFETAFGLGEEHLAPESGEVAERRGAFEKRLEHAFALVGAGLFLELAERGDRGNLARHIEPRATEELGILGKWGGDDLLLCQPGLQELIDLGGEGGDSSAGGLVGRRLGSGGRSVGSARTGLGRRRLR